jgi:hypothetical protein
MAQLDNPSLSAVAAWDAEGKWSCVRTAFIVVVMKARGYNRR